MTNRRTLIVIMALWLLSIVGLGGLYRQEKSARLVLESTLANVQATRAAEPTIPLPEPTPTATATPTTPEKPLEQTAVAPSRPQSPLSELALYGVESRVSALGKVVGINDDQRERLRVKFQEEAIARKKGIQPQTETLEEIIGEENTNFYRKQLNQAFEKSRNQEIDREVYYTSRKLQFNDQQETTYRQLLATVEEKVKERFGPDRASTEFQNDPSFRVRLTIQENEFRTEWLNQQLKRTLAPEQYQAYVQEQADSSAAELGVWHAP